MGYSTEIQAKLGVDTSSVGTDLQGAKNQFNKWGNDVANDGSKHGANFGGKLTGALEHKILGARHLSGALAVALGLNIEKISEHIAAAIVDGSKEGWEEALKIADSNAKLIQEKITESLTPKKLGEELERELSKAIDKLNSIKGETVITSKDDFGTLGSYEKALNAEQLKEQQEAQHEILEIEKKIRDIKKEATKEEKEYQTERQKASLEQLSDGHKYEELNQRIADTVLEIVKGELSAAEVAKKKVELLHMEHDLNLVNKKIIEDGIKFVKDADEAELKRAREKLTLAEKKHNVEKNREKLSDDINKKADLSKLTIGELASLQGKRNERTYVSDEQMAKDKQFGIDEGLDPQILEAKKKAQQIQALEVEAEHKRLAGDSSGYQTAFDKAGALTKELTDSGKIKNSENDKFTEIAKQIKEDNIVLNKSVQELIMIEKGKFVSQ